MDPPWTLFKVFNDFGGVVFCASEPNKNAVSLPSPGFDKTET